MPSLLKIVFTATTTDAHIPLVGDEGVYFLQCPASGETFVAYTTTDIDMHTSITIPNGWYGRITSRVGDLGGAVECFTVPQIIHGTGSAIPITLSIVNVGETNRTPDAGFYIGVISFHKKKDVIGTFTGTWA